MNCDGLMELRSQLEGLRRDVKAIAAEIGVDFERIDEERAWMNRTPDERPMGQKIGGTGERRMEQRVQPDARQPNWISRDNRLNELHQAIMNRLARGERIDYAALFEYFELASTAYA